MNDPTSTRHDDSTEPQEPVGNRPTLSRPVAHVRSPLLDRSLAAPSSPGTPALELKTVIRLVRPFVVPVIAVAIAFSVIANGALLGVSLVATIAAVAMHTAARRVSFTFAEGFLAFRDRDQWPTGVQEEYDVAYSWPSQGALSARRSSPSH